MHNLDGKRDFEILKNKIENHSLNEFQEGKAEISKVYGFANDYFNAYYNGINLQNKTLLTVCGSGDQWLDAVTRGISKSNIVTYDINRLSIYYTFMKILAIMTHHYYDFITCGLTHTGNVILTDKKYDVWGRKLQDEIKKFWDLFYQYKLNERIEPLEFFIHPMTPFENISYLNDKFGYYDLCDELNFTIPDIPFYNADLMELPSIIDNNSFDIINISNILDYIPINSSLFLGLYNILKNHGIIVGDIRSESKIDMLKEAIEKLDFTIQLSKVSASCSVLQLKKN